MADATQTSFLDPRTYGLNEVRHQHKTWHVEAGIVADTDSVEILHPDYASMEGPFPNTGCVVYTHDGGLVFDFTANSTNSAGDTMVLEAINPHDQDLREQKDMQPGPPNYVEIVHVLADTVTDTAITSAEAAASWNADPLAARWAYATATSATELTLFPKGPEGHIRQGVGSTATNLMGKNTVVAVLNSARLFTATTQVALTAWRWTYQSGKVTVINDTGGAVTAVFAVVTFF